MNIYSFYISVKLNKYWNNYRKFVEKCRTAIFQYRIESSENCTPTLFYDLLHGIEKFLKISCKHTSFNTTNIFMLLLHVEKIYWSVYFTLKSWNVILRLISVYYIYISVAKFIRSKKRPFLYKSFCSLNCVRGERNKEQILLFLF